MSEPILVSGPRGHGFVVLAPVMVEAVRIQALDLARQALENLRQGQAVPAIHAEVSGDWPMKNIRDALRKRWQAQDLVVVVKALEELSQGPLVSVEKRTGQGAHEHVEVRYLAAVERWKRAAAENMAPEKGRRSPEGSPHQWPVPANLPLSSGRLLDDWAHRTLWLMAQEHQLEGHALSVLHASPDGWGTRINGTSVEPTIGRIVPFQKTTWKQALQLREGLEGGSIEPFQAPDHPLDPFVSGTGIVVCIDRNMVVADRGDGQLSGYLDAKGNLTSTLTNARLYSSVDEARKSLRGLASGFRGRFIKLENATFLQVGISVQDLAPGTTPQGDLGKSLAAWIRRKVLGQQVDTPEATPDRKPPKM